MEVYMEEWREDRQGRKTISKVEIHKLDKRV